MTSAKNYLEEIGEKEGYFLSQIKAASWFLLIMLSIYQVVMFPEFTNVIAIGSVFIAWFLTVKVWLQFKMLSTYLISSFIIICYVLSTFYLPLVFVTLENKPLIYNLELPEDVFMHSLLALFVFAAAHMLYKILMEATPTKKVSVMDKLGFFTPPSHLQLWIMGLIGTASSLYVYFFFPDIGREVTGAASDKLLQALVPFTYAPFFIPLSRLYGDDTKPSRTYIPLIIAYAVALLAISMGRNSRGAFMMGLTTPVFAYGIGLMLSVFSSKVLTLRNAFLGLIVIWATIGPLSDLATAMLIVRDERVDISATELVGHTLETFNDKDAIEHRRNFDLSETFEPDWDEHYLDNIFTARFANIKFVDANLINYEKVGEFSSEMQEFSLNQLLAIFPDPVIKLFGFDVDKELTLSISFGDYLYLLAGGVGTPTAFRVGHFTATGMAAYGWWYLGILALVSIPIYYLTDKFFRPRRLDEDEEDTSLPFKLSFCAMLALTHFYYQFAMESVVSGMTFLIRGWLQIVVLYFLVFHLSKLLASVAPQQRKAVRLGSASQA